MASWVSMRTQSPHQPGSLTSGLLTSEGEISFGPDVIKPLYVGCMCYSSFAAVLTNTLWKTAILTKFSRSRETGILVFFGSMRVVWGEICPCPWTSSLTSLVSFSLNFPNLAGKADLTPPPRAPLRSGLPYLSSLHCRCSQ